MKKKIVMLMVTASVVLSMTACKSDADVKGEIKSEVATEEITSTEVKASSAAEEVTTVEVVKEETEETKESSTEETTTQVQEDNDDIQFGSHNGNVYENAYFGIGCKLDSSWTCYTDDQIKNANQITENLVGDEYKNYFENTSYFVDMMAGNQNGLDSVSVNIEKIKGAGILVDEETYLNSSADQLKNLLLSMGLEEVSTEMTTVEFAGNKLPCLYLTGEISGYSVYERLICMKKGHYIAAVTVATWEVDGTEDILNDFYKVQ